MSKARITGFAPLGGTTAHTLILGSIPGVASLQRQRYYAHPRNAFWPILCAFLAISGDSPYAKKTTTLTEAGFALWDVLGACSRAGSLDSAILCASETVNPLADFLGAHPTIEKVLFNGAKAAHCFHRKVAPTLCDNKRKYIRLPSTSPANAVMSFAEKRAIWHAALRRYRIRGETKVC